VKEIFLKERAEYRRTGYGKQQERFDHITQKQYEKWQEEHGYKKS